MAIQTWDDILEAAQLSADERKVINNIVQKVPEFKDGRLRQADYDRNIQKLKAQEKEYSEALDYNQKMKAWADETVPRYNSLIDKGIISEDGEELWSTQKTDLEKQLEEAKKAAVGGEMDPAELDKRVKEIVKESGMSLTAEQWKNLYASEGKAMVDEAITSRYTKFQQDFNENTIPFTAGFSAANTLTALKYEKETGQPWTRDTQKEFFDLMTKEKNFDPFEMGDKFIEPKTRDKRNQAEIERLAEERAQKIIAERGGMPGGGSEGSFPTGEARGSLQRMLEQSAKESEGDVESLTMAAGRAAAAELRSQGKF